MSLPQIAEPLSAMSALCAEQGSLLNLFIDGVSSLQHAISELTISETNRQNQNQLSVGPKQKPMASKAWQKVLEAHTVLKQANDIFGNSVLKLAQCKIEEQIIGWRENQSCSKASKQYFDQHALLFRAKQQSLAKCKQKLCESISFSEEKTAEGRQISADTILLKNKCMELAIINIVLSQKIRLEGLELENVEKQIEERRKELARGKQELKDGCNLGGDHLRFRQIEGKLLGDLRFLQKMCLEDMGLDRRKLAQQDSSIIR